WLMPAQIPAGAPQRYRPCDADKQQDDLRQRDGEPVQRVSARHVHGFDYMAVEKHAAGPGKPGEVPEGVERPGERSSLNPRPAERHHQPRSEEHTSELQSRENLVCRLLLEKKKKKKK